MAQLVVILAIEWREPGGPFSLSASQQGRPALVALVAYFTWL